MRRCLSQWTFPVLTFLYLVQIPPVSSQTSSRVDKMEKCAAPVEDKPLEQYKPTPKGPEMVPSSSLSESGESKKKAADGFSLFEGIDVVSSKQTKLLDAANDVDGFLPRDSPPLTVKKEGKALRNTFSLFDDDEEDESDWNKPIFTSSKPNTENTLKVGEDVFEFVALWSLCCLSSCVMFSTRVRLQRSNHRPKARGCFRTRSSCSVRHSRRTTTQMLISLPPQGKPQSVDSIFVSVYLLSALVESKQM